MKRTKIRAKINIRYIPINECIDGNVYLIGARNGRIGIFKKNSNNAFTLSRYKFDRNYLFDEYHYDNGPPLGTVFPIEDLGKAPDFKGDDEKLAYLNKVTKNIPDRVMKKTEKQIKELWKKYRE